MSKEETKPTSAWYLIPFFLTWIGGIIMYFALKDQDRGMANNGLIFGILMTIVGVIFWGLLWFGSFVSMYG